VCDREADRIQIFSPDGEYLSQWTNTQRPTHITFDKAGNVYVTELAWHEGDHNFRTGEATKQFRQARMSVYDKDGKVLCRWGTPQVESAGNFAAPHGLALDSKNDLYVSEVTWTFAVSRGRAAEDCHTFQKFSLRR
jgi:sugar lactone lactonase YvrE